MTGREAREEGKSMPSKTEMAEVSAAKSVVWEVLDDLIDFDELLIDPDQADAIQVADRIVEALMKRGVLVPEWFPDPANGGKPAQGYYPTSSQIEAWEGRKVTPKRVTGR